MSRYSAEGVLTYLQAVNLAKELKASNILADITVGGVAVYIDTSEELNIAESICKKHNALLQIGITRAQDRDIYG